jgi:glutamyl-tRNA reductase
MHSPIDLANFVCIGINHWKADVSVREKFSLGSEAKQRSLLKHAKEQGIRNIFTYSTCNRTEIFAYDAEFEQLIRLLINLTPGSKQEFLAYGFQLQGEEAITHLFEVAVGLDSQILGDLQIIKQVKDSIELARAENSLDSEIQKLLQLLFMTHKRARTETALGQGAATTAYAAIRWATERLENLEQRNILLVGIGKIGQVTCSNLLNNGCKNITVTNRTAAKAEAFAKQNGISWASFTHLAEQMAFADLVIVTTGADGYVIRPEHMELARAKGSLTVFLDMSAPRNVDPIIDDYDFVDVANMDMLSEVTDEAYRQRAESIPLVKEIIKDSIQELKFWIAEQAVVPTIKALTQKLDGIRAGELEKVRHKSSEQEMELLKLVTKRIISKIAAYSIEHLKDNQHDRNIHSVVQDMFKLQ